MDKIGKVKSLNDQIKELEKIREEIQTECRHKNTYLKFADGTSKVKEYCCDCEKELGYPEPKKLDFFLSGR